MWPIVHRLLAGSRVVPLAAVAAAVRLLAERHRVIAEGAGATAVAAAMAWVMDGASRGRSSPAASPDVSTTLAPPRKIVCIVSGGNIDTAKLATILAGGVP
jgi:threonine dehydratase